MKNKQPYCQIPRAGANNSGESQKVSEDMAKKKTAKTDSREWAKAIVYGASSHDVGDTGPDDGEPFMSTFSNAEEAADSRATTFAVYKLTGFVTLEKTMQIKETPVK